jgi:chromosome segregation ATPase
MDFGGDYPMDYAVDEEPLIMPLPIISAEDLRILQAQAAASGAIQEALDVALLNVQTITNERNAGMTREAQLAQSLQESTFNFQVQAQQNAAALIELNGRLGLMTAQRDTAVNNEVEMARQMEVVTGRERDLALEKDAADARVSSLEEKLEATVSEIRRKQSDLDSVSLKISELTVRISEKSQEVSESGRHLSLAREEINRLQGSLAESQALSTQQQQTSEASFIRLRDSRNEIEKVLTGERDAAFQQKNNVSRELVNFKNESQKQTSKIQEQAILLESKEKEISKAKETISDFKGQVQKWQTAHEKEKKRCDDAYTHFSDMSKKKVISSPQNFQLYND